MKVWEEIDLGCDYGYELLMVLSRVTEELSSLAYDIGKGNTAGYGKITFTLSYENQ